MTALSTRLNGPISTAELERRWATVRETMDARGVDALLMQSTNDLLGGYGKYFTDIPAVGGAATTLVFPANDPMTIVTHGPFDGDIAVPSEGNGIFRGIHRHLTGPYFPSVYYTDVYDAELVAQAVAPYARGTIGLLGAHHLAAPVLDHLRREHPACTWINFSDEVDAIKAVKSAEEQQRIRLTAAIQDAAIEAAFRAAEPGKRDREVASVAQRVAHELGAESGLYFCGSWSLGDPALPWLWHSQNRLIEEGDFISMVVECNGPGGFYVEIGRTAVLGSAPASMVEELEVVFAARDFTLERLRPGVRCADIWDEYNDFLAQNGRPREQRLHCHGQGYDLVERPLIRSDETLAVAAGNVFACHPTWIIDGAVHRISDCYLVNDDGNPEPLHGFPRRTVEL